MRRLTLRKDFFQGEGARSGILLESEVRLAHRHQGAGSQSQRARIPKISRRHGNMKAEIESVKKG